MKKHEVNKKRSKDKRDENDNYKQIRKQQER